MKLWDLTTGKCLLTTKFEGVPEKIEVAGEIAEVAFVHLSNGSIWSLNLNDGRQQIEVTSTGMNCFAFGEGVFYLGMNDYTIRALERDGVKPGVEEFLGHSKSVEQLRYYPPGLLVSCSRGGEIRVWNAMRAKSVVTTQGERFALVETIESGATLVVLGSGGISLVNVQETVKALKVQNALCEADSGLTSELFLAHCDLTVIPPELFSNKQSRHITQLYVNNNAISRLGSGLAKMRALTTIEAQYNKLTSVASAICSKLTLVESLLLGANELTYIPGEIGRMERLDLLDLSQNRLEYLPASLAALRELTTLFLHDNYLGGPPENATDANASGILLDKDGNVIHQNQTETAAAREPFHLRTVSSALLSPRSTITTGGHNVNSNTSIGSPSGSAGVSGGMLVLSPGGPAPRLGPSALNTGFLAAISMPINSRNLSLKPTISFRDNNHGALRPHITSARDITAVSTINSPSSNTSSAMTTSVGTPTKPPAPRGSASRTQSAHLNAQTHSSTIKQGEKSQTSPSTAVGTPSSATSKSSGGNSKHTPSHSTSSAPNGTSPEVNNVVSPRSPRKEPKGDRKKSNSSGVAKKKSKNKSSATLVSPRGRAAPEATPRVPHHHHLHLVDNDFVSPALRNASLRKSLHRYSAAPKVSAKYSDLNDLANQMSAANIATEDLANLNADGQPGTAPTMSEEASAPSIAAKNSNGSIRIIDGIVKSSSGIKLDPNADPKPEGTEMSPKDPKSEVEELQQQEKESGKSISRPSSPTLPTSEGTPARTKGPTRKKSRKSTIDSTINTNGATGEKTKEKEKDRANGTSPRSGASSNTNNGSTANPEDTTTTTTPSPRKLGSSSTGTTKKSKKSRPTPAEPRAAALPATENAGTSSNAKEAGATSASGLTASAETMSRLPIDKIQRQPTSSAPPTPITGVTPRTESLLPPFVATSRDEYLTEENVKVQVFFEDLDFSQMQALKLLHLQANNLESVPRSLGYCTSLTDLDLAENRLTEFSEALCNLSGLLRLSLASNDISRIPDQFTKLSKLQELYLDENRIEALPSAMTTSLSSLRILHLSHNQLSALPHNFGKLPYLTELNLSHNDISTFPAELVLLKPLSYLAIDGNGLKELPIELFFLPNLKSLEARDNMLSNVPYASLVHVECLQLDNNRIETITRDIGLLDKVADLSFNGNPLSEIAEDIGELTNLIRLDLSNTPIIQIPESICLLPKLRKLILSGNHGLRWPSLDLAEELETERLIEWMVNDRFGPLKPSDKHRVCFVGLESSGKSSLFNYLKSGKPSKKVKPTRGIEFDTWSPKVHVDAADFDFVSGEVPAATAAAEAEAAASGASATAGSQSSAANNAISTASKDSSSANANSSSGSAATTDSIAARLSFNVWDFSGNEDYRLLHQLFVSEGAVYVLVWNLALDESRSTIPYWLHTIHAHAGPKAPVLIVGTHLDQLKPADAERTLKALHSKYGGALCAGAASAPPPPHNSATSQKYPNVRAIIGASAAAGTNVEKIAKKICALAMELRRGERTPASFQKVLAAIPKDLQSQPISAPVMEMPAFEKFSSKFGLDEFASTALLRYLGAVGAVVPLQKTHYHDLEGVIVDPMWFVKVYADVFGARHKYVKDGVLKHDALEQIWKDAGLPTLAHYTFVAVLHKLEMCFDDGNHLQQSSRNFYSNMSLFPNFLPEFPPDPWPSHIPPWARLAVGTQEISLSFKFGFIAASLMPKLMARVFTRLRPLIYWKSGFLVQSLPDVLQPLAEPEMSAYLELTPHNDVRVWIRGSHMYSCMNLLLEALLKVVASYKTPPAISLQRHLQCAFKTSNANQVELVAVSMHKVEYEISRGVTVLQLTTGGQIPLTHIHADMAAPITQFTTI